MIVLAIDIPLSIYIYSLYDVEEYQGTRLGTRVAR